MTTPHFSAFLSYCHRDRKLAEWLGSRIETFVLPPEFGEVQSPAFRNDGSRRLKKLFRDEWELEAGADLGAAILDALRRSEKLVVICSRASARSTWVDQELRAFAALGKAHAILPLIIDGAPDAARRGLSESAECFPAYLLEQLRAREQGDINAFEPIGADIRDAVTGRVDRPSKHIAFLKVVAGIAEIEFDSLYQRNERRRVRSVRRSFSAVLLVAVMFALVAGIAVIAAITAETRANRALLAESDLLANKALEFGQRGNHGAALKLARLALPKNLKQPDRPFSDRAHQILRASLQHLREERVFFHDSPIIHADFAGDQSLITLGESGELRMWSLSTGQILASVALGSGAQTFVVPTGRADLVYTAEKDGVIALRRLDDLHLINRWKAVNSNATMLLASRDSTTFLSFHENETVRLWRINTEQPVATFSRVPRYRPSLVISPNGRFAAFSRKGPADTNTGSTATVVDLKEASEYVNVDLGGPIWSMVFSADSKNLLVGSGDRGHIIDLDRKIKTFETSPHRSPFITSVAFNHEFDLVLTGGTDGEIRVSSAETMDLLTSLTGHSLTVHSISVNPIGNRVVALDSEGNIKLWRFDDGFRLRPDHDNLRGYSRKIRHLAFDTSGDRLVSVGDDGSARVWRLELPGFKNISPGVPDTDHILAAAPDHSAAVLKTKTGEILIARYLPNGRIETQDTGYRASVANAETGMNSSVDLPIQAVFSPDADLVAIASLKNGLTVFRTLDFGVIDRELDWRAKKIWLSSSVVVIVEASNILRARFVSERDGFVGREASRQLSDNVNSIAMSPIDSSFVVGLRNGIVRLLSLDQDSLRTIETLELSKPISALEITASGKHLAAATFAGEVNVYLMDGLARVWQRLERDCCDDLSWSKSGKRLATMDRFGGRLRVLDGNSGKNLFYANVGNLSLGGPAVRISEDDRLISGYFGSDLRAWDIKSGIGLLNTQLAPVSPRGIFPSGGGFAFFSAGSESSMWSWTPPPSCTAALALTDRVAGDFLHRKSPTTHIRTHPNGSNNPAWISDLYDTWLRPIIGTIHQSTDKQCE